jgi:ATP-dependent protease Clp ATPase subunit
MSTESEDRLQECTPGKYRLLEAFLAVGRAVERGRPNSGCRLPLDPEEELTDAMEAILTLFKSDKEALRFVAPANGSPDRLEILVLSLVGHLALMTDHSPNVRLVSELVGRERPAGIIEARLAIRRLCERAMLTFRPGNEKPWNGMLSLSSKTHKHLGLHNPNGPLFVFRAARPETAQEEGSPDSLSIPKASALSARIRESVKGAYLEQPIQAITAMYMMHMHRVKMIRAGQHPGTPNIIGLLVGSSSVGKTFLAETTARCLNEISGQLVVPFSSFSATDLTAEGYVGCSVEDVVKPLLEQCGGDAGKARFGCCLVDEFDKKAARLIRGEMDVGGRCVQENLLRVIGGSTFSVGGRRAVVDRSAKFNSDGTMFILAGAFVGLDQLIAKRRIQPGVIGFGSEQASRPESRLRDALIEYGLLPEIISRIGSIVLFPDPLQEDLKTIVSVPGGLLACYRKLWKEMGMTVELTESATTVMAGYGMETRSFARGMQAVLNRLTERLVSEERRGVIRLGVSEIRRTIESMSAESFGCVG